MLQGVVIRVLVMAVSNNWVWEQPPLPVPFPHEYIVDVPTAYVRGAAVEFYPVVMMHGMNDAGHTGHMERMRLVVSDTLDGAYVTSVQIGRNVREDEYNSVHLTMDEQVSRFAAIVRRDPNLRHGFHAIGFSQGGLIVRGYIERYNNPPVIGFLACHSPLAGIGSLPICNPTTFFCRQLNKFFGAFAYSSELQHQLAQSNFYRDPTRIPEYRERVKYLPDLNNELSVQNATYKANFASLRQLIMVRALRDTQVCLHLPLSCCGWLTMRHTSDCADHVIVVWRVRGRWVGHDLADERDIMVPKRHVRVEDTAHDWPCDFVRDS
ncbi:hypothetical protein, variant 2 [Aphanomyces invadans]|uniref:Palmitoyl-protein thioesterase 1 n=1 Tax=Aphanomyces invadans TaxID=157072 RepID=A0A024TTM6_9STRA|nr:hypothetical protein, variant 2 [Aphanomyces invadans]ETV97500.1 hypothetical protein, variant 2 [Aphanomyces invadans]|eukprot:XP_008873707.1 hypothetical protein, variant 2 [Aphanomyces invadans]